MNTLVLEMASCGICRQKSNRRRTSPTTQVALKDPGVDASAVDNARRAATGATLDANERKAFMFDACC